MIQAIIGDRIKQRRIRLGITQEQLALQADVTPAYLGQVERGERNPTVGFLEKISEALDIDINYLFSAPSVNNIGPVEKRILDNLSMLNNEQKETVEQVVSIITKSFVNERFKNKNK